MPYGGCDAAVTGRGGARLESPPPATPQTEVHLGDTLADAATLRHTGSNGYMEKASRDGDWDESVIPCDRPRREHPREPITVSDGGDDDMQDEDEDEECEDQLLYQWHCPACKSETDLQVVLQRGSNRNLPDGEEEQPWEGLHGSQGQEQQQQQQQQHPQPPQKLSEQQQQQQPPQEPQASAPPPKIGEYGFVPNTFSEKMWLSLELTDTVAEPFTTIATVVVGMGLIFILLSVVVFIVESHPYFYKNDAPELFIIEATCIGYFTLELVARSIFCPDFSVFIREWYTVIDALSILPFYITLIAGKSAAGGLFTIRILRLMRIFRVFKVSKYNDAVHVVLGSLQKSTEGLYLLLFLILLSTILFSSALYFVEREYSSYDPETKRWYTHPKGHPNREQTPFQSVTHTFWWALVTLTTVGYGNEVPRSPAGKAVAACTMLCGTLVIAFPMVIIGQNFQEMYASHKRKLRARKRKVKAAEAAAASPASGRKQEASRRMSRSVKRRDVVEVEAPTPPPHVLVPPPPRQQPAEGQQLTAPPAGRKRGGGGGPFDVSGTILSLGEGDTASMSPLSPLSSSRKRSGCVDLLADVPLERAGANPSSSSSRPPPPRRRGSVVSRASVETARRASPSPSPPNTTRSLPDHSTAPASADREREHDKMLLHHQHHVIQLQESVIVKLEARLAVLEKAVSRLECASACSDKVSWGGESIQ